MAFSHNIKGQNISYVIPSFIIKHYLDDITKFGHFLGVCSLDIEVSTIENISLRKYYLDDISFSGIFVDKVNPIGSVGHLLKSGDIIHKIPAREKNGFFNETGRGKMDNRLNFMFRENFIKKIGVSHVANDQGTRNGRHESGRKVVEHQHGKPLVLQGLGCD